jgi:hypothetical protein
MPNNRRNYEGFAKGLLHKAATLGRAGGNAKSPKRGF